jgi:hypothetical protein
VPSELKFADGFPVQKDWNRVMSTCYNGASCISQAGGLACCTDEGYAAMLDVVAYYKVRKLPMAPLVPTGVKGSVILYAVCSNFQGEV